MSTAAQTIISTASTLLQDTQNIRWTVNTLVGYLDEAQLKLMDKRPDAFVTTFVTPLVAGAVQQIPRTASCLIDVVGNTVSRKALRKVDASLMDSINPGWQVAKPALDIAHFMYDIRFPRDFYVYPPALATSSIDLLCPKYPDKIVISSVSGSSIQTFVAVGNVTAQDQWVTTLLNWVLFRAWSVDAEFGGNAQMAASHLALFNEATSEAAPAQVAPTK